MTDNDLEVSLCKTRYGITQHRTRPHDNTPIHSNRFHKTIKTENKHGHTQNNHTPAIAFRTEQTPRQPVQPATQPEQFATTYHTTPHHTTPHHTHWSIHVGLSRCVRRRWVFTRHGRAWTAMKQVSLCSLLADIVNRRSWEVRGRCTGEEEEGW